MQTATDRHYQRRPDVVARHGARPAIARREKQADTVPDITDEQIEALARAGMFVMPRALLGGV